MLNSIAPFFIVDDLQAGLDFYCLKLGFEVRHKGDCWAFVGRDGVMLMLKHISSGVHPQPNPSRHEWARWDAYINTSEPDSLYREYVASGVPMHSELHDTSDGLRAFEVMDNSGYVLCFGRPL